MAASTRRTNANATVVSGNPSTTSVTPSHSGSLPSDRSPDGNGATTLASSPSQPDSAKVPVPLALPTPPSTQTSTTSSSSDSASSAAVYSAPTPPSTQTSTTSSSSGDPVATSGSALSAAATSEATSPATTHTPPSTTSLLATHVDQLRNSDLYLGSGNLLSHVEWVNDGRADILCLVAETEELRNKDSFRRGVLSGIFTISPNNFFHEHDAHWRVSQSSRGFYNPFPKIKYSFEAGEHATYTLNDRTNVLNNALALQDLVAVEDDRARHTSWVIDHSRDGAKGGDKGKGVSGKPLAEESSTTLRFRHELFAVSVNPSSSSISIPFNEDAETVLVM